MFNVLHSQNVKLALRSICGCKFGLFDISCSLESVTTDYHAVQYTLSYMLPYLYGNFAPFSTVTVFNTSSEVLLNLLPYIFSEVSSLSVFRRFTTRYYHFLKMIVVDFYLKTGR